MADESSNARLRVHVHPASGPETFPEVELEGNAEGLIWLAEKLLRMAHAEQEMHTHLDNETNGPTYHSPDGWWLTIGRVDKRRRGKS